jgi:hypothetical protein
VKTTDYINNKIERLPKGYIFTYKDFITEVNAEESVIKSLNRMAAAGKIAKLSKGRFYKPEDTVFGILQPEQYQVVKDLLEKEGKTRGYLTGYSIFNQLGLTTQVSNTLQVGRNDSRPSLKRGKYKITFIKQKNTITKENIPLLQLLDSIRFIKKIPDATLGSSVKRLRVLVQEKSSQDREKLVRLALKYPPFVRALLGAILESMGDQSITEPLKKSLNPITLYKLSIHDNILPTLKNWNIQ